VKNIQTLAFRKLCDEAREAGRETVQMRLNDKFNDETDPVDTPLRVQQRWYDAHPDGIVHDDNNNNNDDHMGVGDGDYAMGVGVGKKFTIFFLTSRVS
jgi:hypothetical protein